MKKTFTLLVIALSVLQLQAQRYKDKLFTTVLMDSVLYGNADNWNNTPQELMMNIFQPEGDTATRRPLLVLAHGGSFINGSRYALDVTYLCNEFAKRGYVCVSIQYRLGIDISKFFLTPGPQFANAVWRGTLDGRAAVRYLRAHADSLGIDTAQIYIGGVSAGGVLGLHEAFLDVSSEVAAADPPIDTASIGVGIKGLSGTLGESWRVKGVISLCGAISDVRWMNNNRDVSIFSVHGTNDQTVPYKTDYFTAFSTKVAKLSGGFAVDSMAKVYGMKSVLYTFVGAPHVPFSPGVGTTASSTAYRDTTETLLRDFLVDDLNRKVGLSEMLIASDVKLYPNPSHNQFNITVNKGFETQITLFDMNGKVIYQTRSQNNNIIVNTEHLSSGLYFVTIQNEFGSVTQKLLKN
jgi:poly(3-hydroxybutyrate) depolymerase